MSIEYHQDTVIGTVQLRIYPTEKEALLVPAREFLPRSRPEPGKDWPAYDLQPLVQFAFAEFPVGGSRLSCKTLAEGPSVYELVYDTQEVVSEGNRTSVVTTLKHPDVGYRAEHILEYVEGQSGVTVKARIINAGDRVLTLEHLSSFALGGITPFDSGEAVNRMAMHRFRSWWSAEGRHECRDFESMHFERAWAGAGNPVEKFGQVGSMPVTEFFPFVGIEDKVAGVFWGAQLKLPGSWQIEVLRRDDHTSISGGLADRMLGHWTQTLQPGASMTAPEAWLTTCTGGLETLTQRLTSLQEPDRSGRAACESNLPVMFNEWCSNWGNTSHDKVIALAERVKDLGIEYFVIDAGWARPPSATASQSEGDWVVDSEKFPDMRQTARELTAMGYVPGIWFEFEVVNSGSVAFQAHQLHRDGRVLQVDTRRFWDFRDPWVTEYLSRKVIGFLNENGFRYIKVDYNETLGLGVDSEDGLGEGLRQHLEGVQAFFRKIRAEVPGVVIENCSSGGHRLEPSMMALADMASFSDAHRTTSIPIIARNVQHLILPSQSQIWAVLMPEESDRRLIYSLAGCLYGRMCLSGQVHELSDAQLQIVKKGVDFYKSVAPVIKTGWSHFHESMGPSYRDPTGWLAVLREGRGSSATGQALLTAHAFENAPTEAVRLPLPGGEWRIDRTFGDPEAKAQIDGSHVVIHFAGDFSGLGIRLLAKAAV